MSLFERWFCGEGRGGKKWVCGEHVVRGGSFEERGSKDERGSEGWMQQKVWWHSAAVAFFGSWVGLRCLSYLRDVNEKCDEGVWYCVSNGFVVNVRCVA